MSRLKFNSSGKLIEIDNASLDDYRKGNNLKKKNKDLKKSDSLQFLNQEDKKFEDISKHDYWSFYSNEKLIPPLRFSNGKTQEDVVKEIIDSVKEGHKVIFLHGVCGSGKSAIALNIARVLGRASIIVPLKNLQKQYEEDYTKNKYLIKPNRKKMKIAMITGRENHDSIINPGISCADPFLPENIKISEKNIKQILEYYETNPLINNKANLNIRSIKRISIAPSNPHWSPILPAEFEVNNLTDSRKRKYLGINGRKFIFYHRKQGCSYYDQYLAYLHADTIIFNAAKYKIELAMGKKPETEIEIIDEADEFLDNLFQQNQINLTRLQFSLSSIFTGSVSGEKAKEKIMELIKLEEKNKRAVGIDENQVFHISDTKIKKILEIFSRNSELETEITLDELNYSNKALEAAKNFQKDLDNVYLTYKKEEDDLLVKLVSTNLSEKVKDIIDKNKTLVFMSGTLHSEEIIRNVMNISDFKIIEAETLNQGTIEITRTGKEFNCKYSNFNSKIHLRKDYLTALSECVKKAKPPVLIHVNAFKDLPTEKEKEELKLSNLISSEELKQIQKKDKIGKNILEFKQGISKCLFTTKCSRGMDFPGDMCKSVLFTKYPNPNISDTFWKILKKTHPDYFWNFYQDKAKREFLQKIYRAIRSVKDHIYVLSPDIRVLNAVKELQLKMNFEK